MNPKVSNDVKNRWSVFDVVVVADWNNSAIKLCLTSCGFLIRSFASIQWCAHTYCVVTNMVVVGWCRRKGCGRDDIDWFIFSLLPCHAIPCDVIMNNLFLSLYLLIRLYLKIGNLSCWLWFLFLVCVSLGHFQLCLQTKLKNQTSLALKIFTGLWSLFSLNFIHKVA